MLALVILLFLLLVCLTTPTEINFFAVLIRLVIYFITFLLLSCSDKQDPGEVIYARVGTNTLTNKNIELSQDPKMANNETVPFLVGDWVDQTVFLSAAKEGGLDKDMRLIKKRNDLILY